MPDLNIPHPVVDDNKQTLNLGSLRAWEVLLNASLAAMQAEIDAIIGGGSIPTGPAGGDLTGTYPNPTIGAGKVTTSKYADGSISEAKLADGAVTSAKILNGAIVDADISGSAAIQQSKIASLVSDLAAKQDAATAATDAELAAGLASNSTGDRARANHTGTQAASTISDFSAAANSALSSALALKAPLASPTFTGTVDMDGATSVTVPTADDPTEAVNLAQMQQEVSLAAAGYTRFADVDLIGTEFARPSQSWQRFRNVSYTRVGNVITSNSNGALRVTEVPKTSTASGDEVSVGDELLIRDLGYTGGWPDCGIFVVTDTGSPSTPWVIERRSDADTTGDLVQFSLVRSRRSGMQLYLDTPNPITLNTTAQDWQPYWFYPSEHAASHAPSGDDPIATATATTITGSNAEGTSESLARADHDHALPSPEIWLNVGGPTYPFANGWVNFGGSHAVCSFYKDDFEIVRLKGLIKSGTIGATVFTLPAGYRPPEQQVIAVIANGAIGRLDINPSGTVVATSGNNTYFSLNNVSFRT